MCFHSSMLWCLVNKLTATTATSSMQTMATNRGCFPHLTLFSYTRSGRVGGSGADWPPVGTGERWRGPHEQRAGLWRHVHQGAAERHLLTARSLCFVLGALKLNCDHCRDLVLGEIPSFMQVYIHWFKILVFSHLYLCIPVHKILKMTFKWAVQLFCFFLLLPLLY